MNSLNNMGDIHSDGDGAAPGSVSRSGRVRKKNSLLDVYDSTDIIEKRKRRGEKAQLVKNSNKGGPRSQFKNHKQGIKKSQYHELSSSLYRNAGLYGPPDLVSCRDGDVPDLGAEEIVDDSPEEDTDMSNSFHRLKSQAQSTYMMEKSFFKQRKVTGQASGTKTKATRKDKGTPRVTGYMLWSKSQTTHGRSITDMRDLWATLPISQKKMWKAKAAKIMKKKINGTGNMKNSAGPGLILAQNQMPVIRKGMKNTTPQQVYMPKRPPGRPPKKSLLQVGAVPAPIPVPGPSAKGSKFKTTQVTKSQASTSTGQTRLPSLPQQKQQQYQFKVIGGTNTLDVAARLSLLGEQMKSLAADVKNKKDLSTNESLSILLDSLLCSIPGLLSLTKHVPELDCVPESKLQSIINNTDYIMPGI